MRICYLGWGSQVHLERWASYFANSGHEVSVISVSKRGKYPAAIKQFSLEDIPFSYRLRSYYLRYLLWQLQPTIVHVHWAHFADLLDGYWSSPLIITAWGSDIYRLDSMSPGTAEKLVYCLRQAKVITCDSQDLAQSIESLAGLSTGRVEVIQWGVNTEKFRPKPGTTTLAKQLGIVEKSVVLSPRDFTPTYNLETIIHAFRHVCEIIPSAVLLMKYYRGDLQYLQKIREIIRKLGLENSVYIIEKIDYDQMPDFYRTGKVLVSVPHSDATPMSLLEGMACGCIPVVSDLPSIREWIQHGQNGYLVPGCDIAALAQCIIQALQDTDFGHHCVQSNLDLIERKASQKAHMEKMEEIYASLLENKLAAREINPGDA